MRRSTLITTVLAIGGLAVAAIWVVSRTRRMPSEIPRPETALYEEAIPLPIRPDLRQFNPPPEPAPPAIGTAARDTYLQAMVAGEERSLATVRKALAEAKAGQASADPTYVHHLASMERTYAERLRRHRQQTK